MAMFFSKSSDVVSGFFRIAIISRYLGPENFGQYSWILAFILLFSPLMNFEINHILTREIVQNERLAGKYFGNALILKWAITLCFAVPILVYIKKTGTVAPYVAIALFIALVSEIFVQHTMLFEAVFNAYEKMEYNASLNVCSNFLGLGLIFLAAYYDLGFLGIFGAISIPNFIRAAIGYVIAQRVFVKPELKPDFQLIKHFLRETLPLTVAAFLFGISFRIDILLLSYFKTPEEVALFSLSDTLIKRLQIIPIAIGTAFFPILSRLAVDVDRSLLINIYETSMKWLFIISLPITALMISFSERIINTVSGVAFQPAANSFAILAVSFSLTLPFFFLNTILIALKMQKWLIISSGACLVVNGFLDIILIPLYSFKGASIATIAGEIVGFFVLFYLVSQFLVKIPLARLILKPMLCSALLLFWLVQFSDKGIIWQGISVLIGAVIYLVPLVLFDELKIKKINLDF